MSHAGPAWDLTSEYQHTDDPVLAADLAELAALVERCAAPNALLVAAIPTLADGADEAVVQAAQTLFSQLEDAARLLANAATWASCRLSVDSTEADALALQGRLENLRKAYAAAAEPLNAFTKGATDAAIEAYLADPRVAPARFSVSQARKERDGMLGLAEEDLLNTLAVNGIDAWDKLYTQLSGTLQCTVTVGNEQQTMGLASAAGLLQSPVDRTRESAWRAANTAWAGAGESCAAALNAIAGWRLDVNARRSQRAGKPVHVLDDPCQQSHIERSTLDTLLAVAGEAAPLARKVASLQARAYGKEQFSPWDLRAPAPDLSGGGKGIPFEEGLAVIREAYGQVDPQLGDFVQMMADQGWIEGTQGPRKRTGAYCTRFAKSRTPRVYMTYSGGASDVITLAHELGHAFHSWVMRDLPRSQHSYGMSLAETASTFGETIVRDALLERASTPEEEFDILWEDVSALPAFVLNIPSRFAFEQALYQRRAERPLRVDELSELMAGAWQQWYGDCLSEPDPWFWASKLHFYISELGFYNFPYLFGYLFSLGVYAQRPALGDRFYPAYCDLLLDTGRLTAEQVASQHLGADLGQPAFWRASVAAVQPRVERFEQLVDALV